MFIHDDFLLSTEVSRQLYHDIAADLPIIDYHNHLPPADIAGNRRFANLYEIWLAGDHYKWRAMRANGVAEEYCTGDASPYEKYLAYARTVPATLRNPLYHWTHLELKRFFDIDTLLNESTAREIWERSREMLQESQLSTQGILQKFRVRVLCTTDDPTDDLAHHQALKANRECETRVLPTFRPDRALFLEDLEQWRMWLDRLADSAHIKIHCFADFLDALHLRHDTFHDCGARLSDHGLESVPCRFIDDRQAEVIFKMAQQGEKVLSSQDQEGFATYMLHFFSRLDAEKGWTKQLHIGALRNNNRRLFERVGRDIGCDSISDLPQVKSLSRFLDRLDYEGILPKMVIYNVNPADNYLFSTMAGNFQDESTPGKIQFGSGWWHLDQKEGMEWQLNALSNTGLLSRFVGMLTDSRSFMSFTRHEYFRRILCDLIGRDVHSGAIPHDESLLRPLIEGICYRNAEQFFGF